MFSETGTWTLYDNSETRFNFSSHFYIVAHRKNIAGAVLARGYNVCFQLPYLFGYKTGVSPL